MGIDLIFFNTFPKHKKEEVSLPLASLRLGPLIIEIMDKFISEHKLLYMGFKKT